MLLDLWPYLVASFPMTDMRNRIARQIMKRAMQPKGLDGTVWGTLTDKYVDKSFDSNARY